MSPTLIRATEHKTPQKEDDNGNDVAFSPVVDSELFRLDSVVRWLEAAEGRLRRAIADGWTPGRSLTLPPASNGLPTRHTMGTRR
ncbi:MAG TPA: hypothetical protein VMI73_06330 [Trebonia sp.]|nr:hypothetical protein [Trebonia sp.]